MANRENLDRWFHELWTQRNAAIIDELMDPDCKTYGLPETQHGTAAFKQFFELFGAAFPKVSIHAEEAIESGDRIAFRCGGTVTTPDGKEHPISGGGICRFKNGRCIEAWNQWDFLALMVSMGHVKEMTFVDALRAQIRPGSNDRLVNASSASTNEAKLEAKSKSDSKSKSNLSSTDGNTASSGPIASAASSVASHLPTATHIRS